MIKYFKSLLVFFDYLGVVLFYYIFLLELFVLKKNFISYLLIVLLMGSWFLISTYSQLYKNAKYRDAVLQYSVFIKTFFLFFISGYLLIQVSVPREIAYSSVFLLSYLYFIATLLVYFVAVRIVLFFYRKVNRKDLEANINTIVIGKKKVCEKFMLDIQHNNEMGINGSYNINSELLENPDSLKSEVLKRFIKIKKIKNIVLFHNSIPQNLFNDLINSANQLMVRMYVIPNFDGVDLYTSQISTHGGYPIIKPIREPLEDLGNRILKRFFDFVFSFLLLVFVLSWLTPIMALLIFLDNPGPIFFKQKRSGYLNKDFYCYKFRSMVVNNKSHKKATTKNDERVTRVGKIIRKTSLDELPQLFNVIKGDMSIVGPRPHMISQTTEYSLVSKKYMIRHFVKPGITGWAQINGSRGEVKHQEDLEQRVEKDIWYIQNWSILLDIKIIFLTALSLIKGDEKAY